MAHGRGPEPAAGAPTEASNKGANPSSISDDRTPPRTIPYNAVTAAVAQQPRPRAAAIRLGAIRPRRLLLRARPPVPSGVLPSVVLGLHYMKCTHAGRQAGDFASGEDSGVGAQEPRRRPRLRRRAPERAADVLVRPHLVLELQHDPPRPEVRQVPEAELLLRPGLLERCLLYTSPSPRDKRQSRMPSSA